MRKYLLGLLGVVLGVSLAFADCDPTLTNPTLTSRVGLAQPQINSCNWGTVTNNNWGIVDSSMCVPNLPNTFTALDTFNSGIVIGNANSVQFNDNSTHYIALHASGTVVTTNFTLPVMDGTNGQALVTNGAGNLSFANPGGSFTGLNVSGQPNLSSSSTFVAGSGMTLTQTGSSITWTSTAAGGGVVVPSTFTWGTVNGSTFTATYIQASTITATSELIVGVSTQTAGQMVLGLGPDSSVTSTTSGVATMWGSVSSNTLVYVKNGGATVSTFTVVGTSVTPILGDCAIASDLNGGTIWGTCGSGGGSGSFTGLNTSFQPNLASSATFVAGTGIAINQSGSSITWTASGTPGGSSYDVQYNIAGQFGGNNGFQYNGSSVSILSPVVIISTTQPNILMISTAVGGNYSASFSSSPPVNPTDYVFKVASPTASAPILLGVQLNGNVVSTQGVVSVSTITASSATVSGKLFASTSTLPDIFGSQTCFEYDPGSGFGHELDTLCISPSGNGYAGLNALINSTGTNTGGLRISNNGVFGMDFNAAGGVNHTWLPIQWADGTTQATAGVISSSTNTWTGANTFTGSITASSETVTNLYVTGHSNSPPVSASTVTSCGTNPTLLGSDMAGTILTGSGSPTSCTLTFANSYTAIPVCVCSPNAGVACGVTAASAASVTFTLSITETKINYICIGAD